MTGLDILMEDVNKRKYGEIIDKINTKVLSVAGVNELESSTLEAIFGFDSRQCYVVIDSSREANIWVTYASPGGTADNVMSNKLENYLLVNKAKFQRADTRTLFIDSYDFKRLFRGE